MTHRFWNWAIGISVLILAAVLFLFLQGVANAQSGTKAFLGSNAVYNKVFASITAPTVSTPVYNIGQSQHIVVVIFPSAVAAVNSIQVRIEGSYDNVYFFPICADITSAKLLGGRVYNIETGYGPFPYVRARSLLATPGAQPMNVFYVGNVIPVVPVVIQLLDRFVL